VLSATHVTTLVLNWGERKKEGERKKRGKRKKIKKKKKRKNQIYK
jgi:hypothetical protein